MGQIADDAFAGTTIAPWWQQHQPGLLQQPPDNPGGYLRLQCSQGGAPGTFHFDDDDGQQTYQLVAGDFDIIADLQGINLAETDLAPQGAHAHMAVLCCHGSVQPEDEPFASLGFGQRNYYHRGIGHATGGSSSAAVMDEYKSTAGAPGVSTFETIDWYDLRDAAALGAAFDTQGARGWFRIRRVGDAFTSWSLPYQDQVPSASAAWQRQHDVTLTDMPELTRIGLAVYSSSTSGNVTGRCRYIGNTQP